jgi:ParB/RepB/Spo0J family partition protein
MEVSMGGQMEQLAIGDLFGAADNLRHDVGDITELAESIKSVGLIEPIVASPDADGRLVVITGHRRLAGARAAGLADVPVRIMEPMSDEDRTVLMLVENLQREDLSALEEAEGYQRLVGFKWSQRKIATKVGRSQPHVSRRLALLGLPDDVKDRVSEGTVPLADAVALADLADHPDQLAKAIEGGSRHGDYGWAARQQRQQIERADKVQADAQALRDAGVPEVEWREDRFGKVTKPPVRIGGYGMPLEHVKLTSHRKADCRAFTIEVWDGGPGEIVELCTKPKNHPKPKDKAGNVITRRVAEETPEQTAYREHAQALEAGGERRVELCRRMVTKPPKGADSFAYWGAVDLVEDSWQTAGLACTLLGIESTPQTMLDQLVRHGEVSGPFKAALAITLANGEVCLTSDWRRYGRSAEGSQGTVTRYLTFLRDHGHTLTDVEIRELGGHGAPMPAASGEATA